MKKLSLLVFIAFFALPVIAQTSKGRVYLKNGTILKGKFKYSENLEKLQIKSAGNIWVFEADEIDSITTIDSYRYKNFDQSKSESPLFFRSEIGVLVGNSENSQSAPFSFTSSVNYSVDSEFSIGAGLGIEFFKESYLPVFLNLEYKFRNSISTPYIFVKGGYQIPLEESHSIYYDNYYPIWSSFRPWPDYSQEKLKAKGGFLVNPGVGYQRMFSQEIGMSFAFGYQFHRLQYSGENDYGLDIDYNRLTIKLGIIFN